MMQNLTSAMTEAGLEQRSGLPGLGNRPRMHPAWDEGLKTRSVASVTSGQLASLDASLARPKADS